MSASLETYLVKLYLDRDARQAFVADPRAAAREAGLAEADVAALDRIDRVGLELAARSFAAKRATQPHRSVLTRLLDLVRRFVLAVVVLLPATAGAGESRIAPDDVLSVSVLDGNDFDRSL
jgi:hypothetical protein